MPENPPESMQHHLRRRLIGPARERWPQVEAIMVGFRAGLAYVAAELPGGQSLPLCRLRFTGVLHTWGFALYLASSDSYKDNILPNGLPVGSPEEALDCAGNLYLSGLALINTPPQTSVEQRSTITRCPGGARAESISR